jgi:hypothetical protein
MYVSSVFANEGEHQSMFMNCTNVNRPWPFMFLIILFTIQYNFGCSTTRTINQRDTRLDLPTPELLWDALPREVEDFIPSKPGLKYIKDNNNDSIIKYSSVSVFYERQRDDESIVVGIYGHKWGEIPTIDNVDEFDKVGNINNFDVYMKVEKGPSHPNGFWIYRARMNNIRLSLGSAAGPEVLERFIGMIDAGKLERTK